MLNFLYIPTGEIGILILLKLTEKFSLRQQLAPFAPLNHATLRHICHSQKQYNSPNTLNKSHLWSKKCHGIKKILLVKSWGMIHIGYSTALGLCNIWKDMNGSIIVIWNTLIPTVDNISFTFSQLEHSSAPTSQDHSVFIKFQNMNALGQFLQHPLKSWKNPSHLQHFPSQSQRCNAAIKGA